MKKSNTAIGYKLKIKNKNTSARCEIFSKLIIKTVKH